MELKPTYTISDDGDEFQVAMYLGDYQVAGAMIPQNIGEDEALKLALNFGDVFVKSCSAQR